jgi:hypothetical protein
LTRQRPPERDLQWPFVLARLFQQAYFQGYFI